MIYAGVGSRKSPAEVIQLMEKIARRLAVLGWTLRSGGAEGADQAFESGARARGGDVEIYAPWPGYHPNPILSRPHPKAYELAREVHPRWEGLSRGVQALMARNSHQILGPNLDDPVKMLVCWTPGGEVVGGTGQAIRLAQKFGVPVINLAIPGALERIGEIVRGSR